MDHMQIYRAEKGQEWTRQTYHAAFVYQSYYLRLEVRHHCSQFLGKQNVRQLVGN